MKYGKTSPAGYLLRTAEWLSLRKLIFGVLILGFFSGLGASAIYRGTVSDPPRTDLTVFFRGAEAVQNGENLYDVKTSRQWNYVYPPLLAVLLRPLAGLPFGLNVLLWYLLSVLSLWGTFELCIRVADERNKGFKAALLASVLCIPVFLNTLTRGQLGTLSLFLSVLVFYLYARNRPVPAGLLLAFAIVLKPAPTAALGVYFLVKREWKICFWAAAGGIFFGFLLPAAVMGWERNLYLLREYIRLMREAVSSRAHLGILWQQLVTPFAEDNQSLYAVATRLRWPGEAAYIQGSNEVLRTLSRAGGAAALVLAGMASRHKDGVSLQRKLLEYSLFGVVMLYFSPVTQIHHFTSQFLLFFSALLFFQDAEPGSGRRKFLEAGIWIAALSYLLGLIFEELSFIGLPVIGSFLFWCMLCIDLLRRRTRL